MGKTLVLAEKPSVGKELARVLGCRKGGEGYLFNINWWKLNGAEVKVVYGDLNNDGKVNGYDTIILRRAVVSGECDSFTAADLDGSGELDSEDIRLHTDYVLGKISTFPVC